MKAPSPVKQDIFELVLEFYRSPSDFPDLLDSQQALPDDITDLLELTAGEVAARSKIFTRASANESPSELIDATSYFTEQVLFAPGGDHYRVLGLNHNASADDIKNHYELLVSLFYQDKDDNSIQSNEADFSRLNRAYSVLRDEKKKKEYDELLKSQGKYRNEPEQTKTIEVPIAQPDKTIKTKVQPLETFKQARQEATKPVPAQKTPAVQEEREPPKPAKTARQHESSASKTLPKILIVDDSATVRAGLSLTLNKEFECITAKDGEKGWKKLNEDLNSELLIVLTDLDMPVLNGYEFMERIRGSENNHIKNIPVIVVTGTEDINAKQKALSAGADDFLAKSTDYIEVLTRVRVHYKLVKAKLELEGSHKTHQAEQQIDDNADFTISKYADDHTDVPILTNRKKEYSMALTVGAFLLISIVIISLVYFTNSTPESADSVVASKQSDATLTPGMEAHGQSGEATTDQTSSTAESAIDRLSENRDADVVTAAKPVPDSMPSVADKVAASSARPAVVKPPAARTTSGSNQVSKAQNKPVRVETGNNTSQPDKPKPVRTVKKPAETTVKQSTTPVVKTATAKQQQTQTAVTKATQPKAAEKTVKPPVKTETKAVIASLENTKPVNKVSEAPAQVQQSRQDMPASATTKSAEDLASPKAAGTEMAAVQQDDSTMAPSVLSDRIPATADVPSVNRISPPSTKEKTDDTDPVAMLDRQASQLAGIGKRELSLFIFKFIRAYEDGNLFQFVDLFDEFAITEDRTNRTGIAEDYKDLFEKTAARRFILGDLDWDIDGNKATGKGFFEVQVWPQGSEKFKTFTGELSISVFKNGKRGIVITELFHNF